MPVPYYHLLGHIYLAVDACEHESSLASALKKAGFGDDNLARGRKLLEEGLELVDRKAEEVGEDRIYEHNLHGSADEVQMWLSTSAFQLKKALDDDTLIHKTLGKSLHSRNHTVTIVAQSLRLIAMVRTEPTIHENLGSARQVHDLIVRGWVLLGKVFKNGDIQMTPGSAGDPDAPVFEDIAKHHAKMTEWVVELGRAADKLRGQPSLIGLLGYVPEGVGLPLGGTAYDVPLHQKAQREELPDFDDLRPDPGWSAGRQGRNNENLGEGWVEPTFE
ncbi:MAG: hypothetical protein ACLFVJ_10725 [Persicimonas sp.]